MTDRSNRDSAAEARYWDLVPSPLGELLVIVDRSSRLLEIRYDAREHEGIRDRQRCKEVRLQLHEYFAGRRQRFDLPIAPHGTPFQRRVWRALRGIEFGTVRSYGDVARDIGQPGAARAIGQANGRNPLPIVIPCHRVIASDGSIGGYTGGLAVKHRLLALEGIELEL